MDAVVLGATGLVGSALVNQLLGDAEYRRVVTIGRRAMGARHPKLVEHTVDLAAPASWSDLVRGDVAFSALGTTLKAAGSKEAQWRVDYTFQYEFARAARAAGVPTLVLISAASSSPSSRLFYSRMKGELERDIAALGFPRWRILRPGLLDGERAQKRTGEIVSLTLLKPLSAILPAKARPVHVSTVARAAIVAARDVSLGERILEARDIFAAG